MKHHILIAVLAASGLGSACASNLSSRWSDSDTASVDAYMENCDRREDSSTVMWECGLTYQFAATTTALDHKNYVDRDIAATLQDGLSGKVEAANHRGEQRWDGDLVTVSTVRYVGEKGTIIQPSIEFYASQVVDGELQVFTCWHTLAMLTGPEQLKKRILGCVQGLKVLVKASR